MVGVVALSSVSYGRLAIHGTRKPSRPKPFRLPIRLCRRRPRQQARGSSVQPSPSIPANATGFRYRAHPRCTQGTYVVRPDAGRLTTPVARTRPGSVGPSAAQRPAIAPLTRRWALRPAGLSFASSYHHDADCQQGRLKRQSHSHYLCDA